MSAYGQWGKILKLALMLGESATGLTLDQIADKLEVSTRTAQRMRVAVDSCFKGRVVWDQRDDGKKYFRLRTPQLDTVALADLAAFFNLAGHAARSFGVYQEEPFEVEWLFGPAVADEAENYIFHPSQQMSRNADGSLTVRFTAGGRLEMAWRLCTWGREVRVVKPTDFWESVRKYLPEF